MNYHSQMMSTQMGVGPRIAAIRDSTEPPILALDQIADKAYRRGYRDARYRAAKIANEADTEIGRLKASHVQEISEARGVILDLIKGVIAWGEDMLDSDREAAKAAEQWLQSHPTEPIHPMADLIASAELKCPECNGYGANLYGDGKPEGHPDRKFEACHTCHGTVHKEATE